MLSKSRLHRRLHRLKETLILVFKLLGHVWKSLPSASIYVIDRLPVAACDHSGSNTPNSTRTSNFEAIVPASSGICMASRFISWSPKTDSQSSFFSPREVLVMSMP